MFSRWSLLAPVVLAIPGGPAGRSPADAPAKSARLPAGWEAACPREEVRPAFSFDPKGGPDKRGAFVLAAGDSVGQHGWVRKAFPVTGGKFYRFQAARKTEGVALPRRSAVARIAWQDAGGRPVRADVPAHLQKEPGPVPLAEPEHPADGETDAAGWTTLAGTYRAPAKAARAVVELHLLWAPSGRVRWGAVTFAQTQAPPARKVRLAAVHHVPAGKSIRANREEFAPLIAEAARRKADLVVLGETVTYVRLGKKPHETAEAIPGPTTDYFAALAKRHKLHVVVGLYERDGKVVYNAAALLGPDGKLIGKYRKVCLPHSEVEAGVAPGKDYPVFQTAFGKVWDPLESTCRHASLSIL